MIYTDAPVYTAHLGVTDSPLNFPLNWTPAHVQVDNYTNQYLYLDDAEVTVGPGVVGRIVPLRGTTQARARFQTPPGLVTPPVIPAQKADLVYLSSGVDASPSPGLLLPPGQLATYSQGQLLTPQYSVAPNTSDTRTVTIQPGMQVLSLFLWKPVSGNLRINVVGTVSGFRYFTSTRVFGGGGNLASRVLVELGFESQVDVTIDATATPLINVPVNVAIVGGPNPVEQVDVNIKDSFGFSLIADSNSNLQVTNQFASPAPWQAPASTAEGQAGIGAGLTAQIVAGVAGQRVYLHGVSLYTPDAGGGFYALRYGGTLITEIGRGASPGMGRVFEHDYKGRRTGAGDGLEIFNPGAALGNVYWTVDYTQL